MNFTPYTQKIMKPMIKILGEKLFPNYRIASLKGYSGCSYFSANVTTPSKQWFKDAIIICDHCPEGIQFKLMLSEDEDFLSMSINLNDFYRLAYLIDKGETEKIIKFMDTFKEQINENNFVRIGQNKNC